MNCANCQKPTPLDEMVADHIVPLSRGGGNGDENIQWVHRTCHRRQAAWYWRLWWSIKRRWLNFVFNIHMWLESWQPCPKEEQGYRCRPGHDLRYALDGSKLAALGWKAPLSFDESLKNTVEWTIAHPEWLA